MGIATGTLSIKADIAINGRAPNTELVDLAQTAGEGIYTIVLAPPLTNVANAHLFASVADQQGNITRVDLEFSVGQGSGPTPTPVPTAISTPDPTLTRQFFLPMVQQTE